jgi:hypothetical protein
VVFSGNVYKSIIVFGKNVFQDKAHLTGNSRDLTRIPFSIKCLSPHTVIIFSDDTPSKLYVFYETFSIITGIFKNNNNFEVLTKKKGKQYFISSLKTINI